MPFALLTVLLVIFAGALIIKNILSDKQIERIDNGKNGDERI